MASSASLLSSRPLLPTRTLQALDPSVQSVWRIKLALVGVILFMGVLFYALTQLFSGASFLFIGSLVGGSALVLTTYIMVWPRLRYRAWGYALHDDELLLEYGVLTHVRTVVPLRRIQHLDVSQNLFEREYDLGRLVIHTAGTRSSDVVIPGLPLATAERIRDDVKQYILNDPLTEDVL